MTKQLLIGCSIDYLENNVKSGTIENADIVVKNGGVLNISDNAKIYLRSTGGNIKSEIGATVNIYSSSIE